MGGAVAITRVDLTAAELRAAAGFPDILDRVQLWGVGRQADERDVGWNGRGQGRRSRPDRLSGAGTHHIFSALVCGRSNRGRYLV
jgi:hypothetical protein